MTRKRFWRIIESGNSDDVKFKKIFQKLSNKDLGGIMRHFNVLKDKLYRSKAVEDLVEELGFWVDAVDYVVEGTIAQGEEYYKKSFKKGLDIDLSELEGIISYPLSEELDERGFLGRFY